MLDFISPDYSPWLVSLIDAIWPAYMKIHYGGLSLEMADDVVPTFRSVQGAPAIICPNHSALEDPDILFGLARAVKQEFLFMTARELFGAKGSLRSLWYQKLGCFSVERARADVNAFKTARDLLTQGKKVVIFPEGEISRSNDWLMDLENGPEHMALAAAEILSKQQRANKFVFIIPVALRYRYDGDVSGSLKQALGTIEEKFGAANDNSIETVDDQSLMSRIRNAYTLMLNDLENGLGIKSSRDSKLSDRIFLLREHLILKCEAILDVTLPSILSQLSRIHILRGIINERRLKDKNTSLIAAPGEHTGRTMLRQCGRWIMLTTNLMAIGPRTFEDRSLSQERAAELIDVLEQSLFRKSFIPRPARVLVGTGSPIEVKGYLGSYERNHRQAILELKTELRIRLESRLQELAG